jgi:hypothetical protein
MRAGSWCRYSIGEVVRDPLDANRSFDRRITKAQVPKITVHGARKTADHSWPP